jgi:hypothetical protein
MVYLNATRAHAKEATPSTNRKAGQTFVDGVDRLYHQLVEIHTIAIVQLTDCACWHPTDPTSIPVNARAGWQKPTVEPSTTRVAPPPPTDFLHQTLPWQRGHPAELGDVLVHLECCT